MIEGRILDTVMLKMTRNMHIKKKIMKRQKIIAGT